MDIRQIEYAVTLADTLHFGRAAARVYIAQSAFSTQIARLEKEIGAQLFDRTANRVAITPAGELFLDRARTILEQIKSASEDAAALQTMRERQLRVGLFHDAAGELTPLIVSAYRQAFPEVELSFCELTMIDQVDAVAEGTVDVAFLRTPLHDSRIRVAGLFAEPRYVGLSEGHRLASRSEVAIEDLIDERFVMASPRAPEPWRGYWAFDDLRGGPSRVATTVARVWDSMTAIAYQNAVDTFPGSATRLYQAAGMVYRPIKDGTYATSAVATRNRNCPAHVDAFLQVALQLSQTALSAVPGAVPIDQAPAGTPTAA
ncbi:DNA-binding transcriptional LysR family regulator [Brevibacterium sanguinis]|uniref:DNA-binding transcriptional LysR family regulator n=2 Tax=Brevibacterium TaxID=1696 RepID=A0A366IQZ7_9MICO|nr:MULTISPECIES: LysR family transcriptional regulator [Brevibacterium]RBP67812.1 DNA-binding transcriptional LysR family regulator [Brevibacterium sanguinis]RBP74771.1 DNA-binding transcriptional LysR family regulator [Brevibacterium celere]